MAPKPSTKLARECLSICSRSQAVTHQRAPKKIIIASLKSGRSNRCLCDRLCVVSAIFWFLGELVYSNTAEDTSDAGIAEKTKGLVILPGHSLKPYRLADLCYSGLSKLQVGVSDGRL